MITEARREAVWWLMAAIADEELQRRAWFGRSDTEVWSADEMFNNVFDDVNLPGFVADSDNGLDSHSLDIAAELVDRLTRLSQKTDEFIAPQDVFYDEEFARIRQLAAELHRLRRDTEAGGG